VPEPAFSTAEMAMRTASVLFVLPSPTAPKSMKRMKNAKRREGEGERGRERERESVQHKKKNVMQICVTQHLLKSVLFY
jgi:hypothetical protein